MSKKFNIITIGGSTMDIMFGLPSEKIIQKRDKAGLQEWLAFELGSKIVSRNVVYACGGGAANAAASLSKLGFKVAILSSVGNDTSSQMIYEKFKKNKVDVSLLQKQPSYTAMSFIVTGGRKKEHVIFKHLLASDLLEVREKTLKNIDCRWYYVSSLSGGHWQKNLETIFKSAGNRKVKVAWNPGQIQLDAGYASLKKYFSQVEVLILNIREAAQLVNSSGKKSDSYKELGRIILSWGVKVVAITEGDKGAYVASSGFSCFQKALKAKELKTAET
jgi:sugar/nucleoside kinase (ribokinase family)